MSTVSSIFCFVLIIGMVCLAISIVRGPLIREMARRTTTSTSTAGVQSDEKISEIPLSTIESPPLTTLDRTYFEPEIFIGNDPRRPGNVPKKKSKEKKGGRYDLLKRGNLVKEESSIKRKDRYGLIKEDI